jgi:hypothetical protein
MARKVTFVFIICLIFTLSVFGLGIKENVKVIAVHEQNINDYQISPRFSSAEICTVRHDDGVYWSIQHWITGDELYKSYQDPNQACTGPYPFTVEDVYFVLYFGTACTMYVSVDVESCDLTDPGCPMPGNLLSISQLYEVTIPTGGLYQIVVPLDSPAVVNEPYFAGFYFAGVIDTLADARLITDSIPVACVAYNIWDTLIGWVDLDSTGFPTFPQFPGRLLLFSSGITGGSSGEEPEPSAMIIRPGANEAITGEARTGLRLAAIMTAVERLGMELRHRAAAKDIRLFGTTVD